MTICLAGGFGVGAGAGSQHTVASGANRANGANGGGLTDVSFSWFVVMWKVWQKSEKI